MSTDGPYISKTFGSASPKGRRDVVSTIDRARTPAVADENLHTGLKRLKSRSWSSVRRWEKENELLFAMIEDESEWLAELFPDEIIAPEFFFFALEDGVLLCKLANLIQGFAEEYGKENNIFIPESNIKFHPRHKTRGQLGQFRARENVTAFLGWCRKHRVPEVILFESNDVVQTEDLREGAREVVICLMEVARRSFKYGVKPPKLILLEKEIDEEERAEVLGSPNSVDSGVDTDINARKIFEQQLTEKLNDAKTLDCIEVKNAYNAASVWNNDCQQKLNMDENASQGPAGRSQSKGRKIDETDSVQKPQTELDKKVFNLVKEYSVGKILRLKEGKYVILGRAMFVRMLNDHVLVRIGGGWDGLEHYLMTHVKAGSQSSSTPACDLRPLTPVSRAEKYRNNRPLSPAASNISLAEGSKGEFRTFTPTLQSNLNARGRESPLRKTSRVKDTDEADISRAIRRIENTVSESIYKKTGSTLSLELSSSVSSCKKTSSHRKLGPSKMATPAISDFSCAVNDSDEFPRSQNEEAPADKVANFVSDEAERIPDNDESAFRLEKPDSNNNENECGEHPDSPVVNGDVHAENHDNSLTEEKQNSDTGSAAITKKETGKKDTKEQKTKVALKKEDEAKGPKAPKANTGLKSATSAKTTSKGSSATVGLKKSTAKNQKVAAPTTAKLASAKATTATSKVSSTKTTTATTAKPPSAKPASAKSDKSAAERKPGPVSKSATKASDSKPAGSKVSASKATVAPASKASASKPTDKKPTPVASNPKPMGKKQAAPKSMTTSASVKDAHGKVAATKVTTTKAISTKSDLKGKQFADVEKPGGDSVDGAALSTKGKVNGENKSSKTKPTNDPAKETKAPLSAKAKTNAVDKAKKPAATSTVKKATSEKVTSKASPAVSKAETAKSNAAPKKVAGDPKSKKAASASASKPSSAPPKSKEVASKSVTPSKPSSASAKAPVSSKSTKPSGKQASAPSSASSARKAPSATKSSKPGTKVAASSTSGFSAASKNSAATKVKGVAVGGTQKAMHASTKAAPATGKKDVKKAKTTNGKASESGKKDTKKPSKASDPEKTEKAGNAPEDKPVSSESNTVEGKGKLIIEAVLPSSATYFEASASDHAEPISIKNSNEAVIIDSVHSEDASSVEPGSESITLADSVYQNVDEDCPKLDPHEVVTDKASNHDEDDKEKEADVSVSPEAARGGSDEPTDADICVASQNKSIRSATFDVECIAADKEEQQNADSSCLEMERSAPDQEDIEEKDSEFAKFDESKLISLEEITAKCDDDDIREGAVAPTPPETPVPDNVLTETSNVTADSNENAGYDTNMTQVASPMVDETGQAVAEEGLASKAFDQEECSMGESGQILTGQRAPSTEEPIAVDPQTEDTHMEERQPETDQGESSEENRVKEGGEGITASLHVGRSEEEDHENDWQGIHSEGFNVESKASGHEVDVNAEKVSEGTETINDYAENIEDTAGEMAEIRNDAETMNIHADMADASAQISDEYSENIGTIAPNVIESDEKPAAHAYLSDGAEAGDAHAEVTDSSADMVNDYPENIETSTEKVVESDEKTTEYADLSDGADTGDARDEITDSSMEIIDDYTENIEINAGDLVESIDEPTEVAGMNDDDTEPGDVHAEIAVGSAEIIDDFAENFEASAEHLVDDETTEYADVNDNDEADEVHAEMANSSAEVIGDCTDSFETYGEDLVENDVKTTEVPDMSDDDTEEFDAHAEITDSSAEIIGDYTEDIEVGAEKVVESEEKENEYFVELDGDEGMSGQDAIQREEEALLTCDYGGEKEDIGISVDTASLQENVSPLGEKMSQQEGNDELAYNIGGKGTEELLRRELAEGVCPDAAFSHELVKEEGTSQGISEFKDNDADSEYSEEKVALPGAQDEEKVDSSVDVGDISMEMAQSCEKVLDDGSLDSRSNVVQGGFWHDTEPLASDPLVCTEEEIALHAEQKETEGFVGTDYVVVNADQSETPEAEIGLQEHLNEGDPPPSAETQGTRTDEFEHSRGDALGRVLNPLDLERHGPDSFFTEEPFTPISDLPEGLRSPLNKDSFDHCTSGEEENNQRATGSDGEGAEFDAEVLERAKESIRVARSLDDSCDNETQEMTTPVDSRAGDDLEVKSAGMFDESFGKDAQDCATSADVAVVPQVISSPCISSDEEEEQDAELGEDASDDRAAAREIGKDSEMGNVVQDSASVKDSVNSPMLQGEDLFENIASFEEQEDLSYGGQSGDRSDDKTQDDNVYYNYDEESVSEAGALCGGKEFGDQKMLADKTSEEVGVVQHEVDATESQDQFEKDETAINLGSFNDHVSGTEGYCDNEENGEQFHRYSGEGGDLEDASSGGVQSGDGTRFDVDAQEQEQENSTLLFDAAAKEGVGEERNDAESQLYDDQMCSSQEKSDAERYIQSDDQATDGSDFVLLDSPVKQLDPSCTDQVMTETLPDVKDSIQASLNESSSDDSPFHHIEVKPDEGSELKPENVTADSLQTDALFSGDQLASKEDFQEGHFLADGLGSCSDENHFSSDAFVHHSTEFHSFETNMSISQNTNQPWKTEVGGEQGDFESNALSFELNRGCDGATKNDNLVRDSFNAGPRYVYDGSDDEDGDDDDEGDETY